ncbi:MAG TPA: subclass B3 metallo-beta-lactamase [Gemmatimonadaceae bacterium]|nr:subclass B3 metallo-beta-lactamase [Gemmatimonadaceae bacterium]
MTLARLAARSLLGIALFAVLAGVRPLAAQRSRECPSCAEWNEPQRPFRLHADTYYVGTHGLSAILITSSAGHVLIDGGLPESAPVIRANIEALGFHVRDVKLILNSHAHFDHAGGIAELQRASGATVMASAASAPVLSSGRSGPDDPQYGVLLEYPAASGVKVFAFEDTLRVGTIAVVPHHTGGHTPGGTSWSWRSCAADGCLDVVYADSRTPVSADGFLFTRSATYPNALDDFARGQALLGGLKCDVLLTPHPSASNLWQRVSPSDGTPTAALADPGACKRFAESAGKQLEKRVADEKAKRAN